MLRLREPSSAGEGVPLVRIYESRVDFIGGGGGVKKLAGRRRISLGCGPVEAAGEFAAAVAPPELREIRDPKP
ncbi:unnamed protein product [Linum trigynum]|uniref:Uncharacterized protein n=1 Tax=Linum trigynum TaxID=586398 RepID=A0AAV2E4X9_9ROSI